MFVLTTFIKNPLTKYVPMNVTVKPEPVEHY